MKRLFAFAFAALLLSCSSPQTVQWFEGSFADAVTAAKNSNKPILLDFFSDT